MVCRDWQRLISGFLENQLSIDEQEAFVSHVRGCSDCYEELEIMFTLSIGLNELENNTSSEISYNFRKMLDNKLQQAEYQCESYRNFEKTKGLVWLMMNVVTIIGIIIQICRWL